MKPAPTEAAPRSPRFSPPNSQTSVGAQFPQLHLGELPLASPVVLAPMAGITNKAFRRLCWEESGGTGLFVSEMVTAKAYVQGNDKTARLTEFGDWESPRSLQFYGVDPRSLREAVEKCVANEAADHIDLNFGCPVPKVTRKGGGAALPWKLDLFRALVTAAVEAAAGRFPVTVKMRVGVDADHVTYREAAAIARDAGVAWVALHARTAQDFYGGQADWARIADLVELVGADVPVLGNGDIWSAQHAIDMMTQTGCAGVVVGRGCLGRPWLFGQLADAFAGRPIRPEPNLIEIKQTYRRHGQLLVDFLGEHRGLRELRKHHRWYFKGYTVSSATRQRMANVDSLDDVEEALGEIDDEQPRPGGSDLPRGRTASRKSVALPDNWLTSRDLTPAQAGELAMAEVDNSGG